MEFFLQLFPGIGTFFTMEPQIAAARLVLIGIGLALAWLGFKRTLEPLIMIPMGIGMMVVNCGMLFLSSGGTGNLLLDPLVCGISSCPYCARTGSWTAPPPASGRMRTARRMCWPRPERHGVLCNMGMSRKEITFDLSQDALRQHYLRKETGRDPQFFSGPTRISSGSWRPTALSGGSIPCMSPRRS